jgi:hypothetical protein
LRIGEEAGELRPQSELGAGVGTAGERRGAHGFAGEPVLECAEGRAVKHHGAVELGDKMFELGRGDELAGFEANARLDLCQ